MKRSELDDLWSSTLRSPTLSVEQFEHLARAVVEVHSSGDPFFRQHIQNRLKQIGKRTGNEIADSIFDLAAAQLLIADEIGFTNWDELVNGIDNHTEDSRPLLFQYAITAMERGDFSALESMVGGPDKFDEHIVEWYEKEYFENEQETLAEVFSAACMLGHATTAEYLLDKGVDPYAGMKTGLSGFHYSASSGRLNVIKLLIERKVPMGIRNMYNGTVFGQALWSAVNEYTPDHTAIIEALIDAGAEIEPGTLEWWEKQDVPSDETKQRVAMALADAGAS